MTHRGKDKYDLLLMIWTLAHTIERFDHHNNLLRFKHRIKQWMMMSWLVAKNPH